MNGIPAAGTGGTIPEMNGVGTDNVAWLAGACLNAIGSEHSMIR
jgi:hypothetical protein